ncbi:prepilin-type N-terminal cleavage/methylation domain-containing protein [Streptomyces sp. NPDC096319]|uniref:prepilin-type N-terminal cleavage/methylation domain-containing protein n=1 Tax=Streptomyces sp. NPDC096319 TaxID=3366084 RepID=UPI003813817C
MTPDHRTFSSRARRQDGFTLIELLVTIVILGVLAAIVVFSVRGIGDKGRKNAVAADAATLRTAEEAYCAKHGRYASIDDLIDAKLLPGEPEYNSVAVGNGNKCGRGASSSFTLYGTSPMQGAADGIPVGAGPVDLAVDEKADRVYVVASGSGGRGNVTVIDGKTDTPIGPPIDVSGAVSDPTRIAVDPGTGRVYVGGAGGLAVIDTANADRVSHIDFAATVSAVAVSPENGDVYVAGGTGGKSTVAYIAAGTSTATPIPLPVAGLVGASGGTDFSFDTARHAVYLAKNSVGAGESDAAGIGLFAISSTTHKASLVWKFRTKTACGSTYTGNFLAAGTAVGRTVVDPHLNRVYLLARRCVAGQTTAVATTIAINPADGSSTAIDDPATGVASVPVTAVYSAASGSVYVYTSTNVAERCGGVAGRVGRITGTTATRQAAVCGPALSNVGNSAHKMAVLDSSNRVLVAQTYGTDTAGNVVAPGGVWAADGTTLLTQDPLAESRQFAVLAVNGRSAKAYAVDPSFATVTVFRTGSA